MSGDSDLQIATSEMNVLFVHSAVDDYPLSTEEFRVYGHLARRAGGGEAWPSIPSIAKKCRIHEDTARRCVHNLIAYGLISVTERGSLGKSNLYRLTPVSQWKPPAEALAIQKTQAETNRAKRAAKKAAQPTPSETKGGVVKEGRGSERRDPHPSETKGGEGSETKGGEVYPLKEIPLRESKRESAAPNALRISEKGKEEASRPIPFPADAGGPDGPVVSKDTPFQEGEGHVQTSEVKNTTVSKKVPGAARRGEMTETEAFLRRKLSGAFVDRLFDELQPLGVDRRTDWPALPLERVHELVDEAQSTHQQHGMKVPTRLRDLLDDECRRRSLPVSAPADQPPPEVTLPEGQVRRNPASGEALTVERVYGGFAYLDDGEVLPIRAVAGWEIVP